MALRRFSFSISEFEELAQSWKRDTAFESSIDAMVLHPAYQKIIGMGPDALPSVLVKLRDEPDHWFWALAGITRENPIPDDRSGNFVVMREAWLDWGRAAGLLDREG
jgi:hypothetical protein